MKSDGFSPRPIFFTKSLSLPCTNDAQVCTCLVGTMPCPAHVANFSLRSSHTLQFQTLYRELHPSGLQTGWNIRVVGWGCRVDVLTLPKQILWCLPHSSSKLVGSLAETTFLLDSCEAEVVRNASEFCQRPDVDLGVDCLPFRHRIRKNHYFTVPEESDHDLARWKRPFFSPRRVKTVLFHGLPFCIRFKIMDPSAVTIRDKTGSLSALKRVKKSG